MAGIVDQDHAAALEGTRLMINRKHAAGFLGGLLALMPQLAFAHAGHGDASGFAQGFMHPVGGLDHILAMIAIGAFAALLGGRALWAVPASFVAMMAAGGALGMAALDLPFVEIGIAFSVVVLGAAVALNLSMPLSAAISLAGFFAVFHGFAHGAEMPTGASGLSYAGGAPPWRDRPWPWCIAPVSCLPAAHGGRGSFPHRPCTAHWHDRLSRRSGGCSTRPVQIEIAGR
jgi:urease accessory protein